MQQEDTILVPEITTFCRSRGFWTTFNFELERPYLHVYVLLALNLDNW